MTTSLRVPPEWIDALADLVAERLRDQPVAEHPPWPEWMSVDTAARYLDCSTERVRKLTARGQIPHVQEGRGSRVFYERAALDAWMRGLS